MSVAAYLLLSLLFLCKGKKGIACFKRAGQAEIIEGRPYGKTASSQYPPCMQTLSRAQRQIHTRRIRMTKENQALQRQLLQKHAKKIELSMIGMLELVAEMGEDWDDSLQSKEQIEARLLSKHEAAMKRERAMAYSFTHQQNWKNASRSMNPLFIDPKNPSWGWSWLEQGMAARPWKGRGTTEKEEKIDQSSIKSARSNFGGEINKAYARYQLNLDKQSLKVSQKSSQTSSLSSPSTPKPASTST
ncbi:hypothetical protein DITRI_Ditri06bG0064500 [Diplodiscus trichospermus]